MEKTGSMQTNLKKQDSNNKGKELIPAELRNILEAAKVLFQIFFESLFGGGGGGGRRRETKFRGTGFPGGAAFGFKRSFCNTSKDNYS